MPTCAVRECEETAARVIDLTSLPGRELPDFPALEWVVCENHFAALQGGEPYSLAGDEMRVILLGAHQVPPRLLTFKVTGSALGESEVTFTVGHAGVATGAFTFQTTHEFASSIIDASIDPDSPLSVELDRNNPGWPAREIED